MEARADLGRRPGDPSRALLELMHRLQRQRPAELALERVTPALYAEARELFKAHGKQIFSSEFWANQGFPTIMFCGHWITPENEDDGRKKH